MCGARRTESGLGVSVFFFVLTNADAMSARPPTWTTVTTQWPLVGAMIATAPDPRDDMTRGASPTAYYDVKVTMKAWAPAVFASILLLAAPSGGCSSSDGADTGTFTDTPATVLTSAAGSYRIALHSAPDAQPSRGVNSLRLVVTKVADGSPATGLAVDVVPWMPAMGHGASVKPSVQAATEAGVYTVSNVNLFMPGLWEIRATIGGAAGDHATAQFEVR